MKIDIYTGACSLGIYSENNRHTGCAIILMATASDGRVFVRKISFGMGSFSINMARLQAIRLGIASLKSFVLRNKFPITVYYDNAYITDMLVKDNNKYKIEPRTYTETVMALRNTCDKTPNLSMVKSITDIGNICVVMAREAATSQSDTDTGSKEYKDVREAGLQEENS